MPQQQKAILIVDDEPLTRNGINRTLEAWSAGKYRILCADNGIEALRMLKTQLIHVLITDIRMPEMTGLQMVETLQAGGHKPVVIVISGHPDFQYAQTAIQLGVVNYLLKPINKRKLLEAVEQALRLEEGRERMEALEKIADHKLLHAMADDQRYSDPVKQAVRYIEEHLQEQLGLSEVAAQVHLNPSYFSALFKEQMGLTFSEFTTRSRLQRAKELLLQTRLPITDIAEKVGYQTSKYFIKLFKDYEGKSPSQYRKEMYTDDQEI
ncbi:response regulator [Paenibacillus chartarius]|uniref:Response regulator n=1 Tax=Paenibacillus chartarius TaxID=747481 RepID=A0ABV6DU47_9BACL